jgi:hypothetical protein
MNSAQLRNQAQKGNQPTHYTSIGSVLHMLCASESPDWLRLPSDRRNCRLTEFLQRVIISMASISGDVEPVRVEYANVGVMVLLRNLYRGV